MSSWAEKISRWDVFAVELSPICNKLLIGESQNAKAFWGSTILNTLPPEIPISPLALQMMLVALHFASGSTLLRAAQDDTGECFKIFFQNCKHDICSALEFSLIWLCSLTSDSLSDIDMHTQRTSFYGYLTQTYPLFKGQDVEILWTYETDIGIYFLISNISLDYSEIFFLYIIHWL